MTLIFYQKNGSEVPENAIKLINIIIVETLKICDAKRKDAVP